MLSLPQTELAFKKMGVETVVMSAGGDHAAKFSIAWIHNTAQEHYSDSAFKQQW
jgi:hypothetical protein